MPAGQPVKVGRPR